MVMGDSQNELASKIKQDAQAYFEKPDSGPIPPPTELSQEIASLRSTNPPGFKQFIDQWVAESVNPGSPLPKIQLQPGASGQPEYLLITASPADPKAAAGLGSRVALMYGLTDTSDQMLKPEYGAGHVNDAKTRKWLY